MRAMQLPVCFSSSCAVRVGLTCGDGVGWNERQWASRRRNILLFSLYSENIKVIKDA